MTFIPDTANATGMGNENAFYLIRVLLSFRHDEPLERAPAPASK